MNREREPIEKLGAIFGESVKAFEQAFQTFLDASHRAAADILQQTAFGDPAAALKKALDSFGQAATRLSALQGQLLQRWLADLPRVARDRIDSQTFGQLSRLAKNNWEEEIRRLSEFPLQLAGKASDPDRLTNLLASMVEEYLADLRSLKDDAFKMDFSSLADAWAKTLSGSNDPLAAKVVERFLDAVSVKSRYGSEYYADPDRTPVGQTPRMKIHTEGNIELYRYQPPAGAPRTGTPVLLVYSVINRSYILDLMPGHSFIEHLLGQGLDVYLIEWGETKPGDRTTTLDSYIDPGIRGCVEAIRRLTGALRVSLFGHCIGGNLALMYAALHPEDVERLVILTTPITSAKGGVVALWTDRDLFPVDAILSAYGHMPAKLIRFTFIALKPYYEVMKWKMFFENLGNDQVMSLFYPVDRWANENVDIPGEVFRKFVLEVFHQERFRNGQTRIHGRRVDLLAITCPILTLAANRDWIVPLDSALILNDLVGSRDNRTVEIEGAHVGIMIDPRSRPLWTTMSDFLLEGGGRAKKKPGSAKRKKGKGTGPTLKIGRRAQTKPSMQRRRSGRAAKRASR